MILKGLGIDERAGDTLLHEVCSILDARNWILPEGMIPNFENVQLHLMKVFESADRICDMTHCCWKFALK